jgi:hypothetical protein
MPPRVACERRIVDAREPGCHGGLHRGRVGRPVGARASQHESRTDRHARLRARARAEAITQAYGHHLRRRHELGEAGRPRSKAQRRMARLLRALGKPPEDPPGAIEQRRRVPKDASAVAMAVEIHSDATRQREEAQLAELASIHQRIRVAARYALGQDEHGEPIPPRGVVRHAEHGCITRCVHELIEALHAQRPELRPHARLGAACEPPREWVPLARRDHGHPHAATSSSASGSTGRASASRSSPVSTRRAFQISTSLRHHDVCALAVIVSHPRARIRVPMAA